MNLLQVLKYELNYHWNSEIDTVPYQTNMKKTFYAFDRNKSKYIELGEFIVGVQTLLPLLTVQECAQIFNTFIKEDPLRITLGEFMITMRIEIDPKKYIKIHNWFETISQCGTGIIKNKEYNGLISIDHFIQYFIEMDTKMQFL